MLLRHSALTRVAIPTWPLACLSLAACNDGVSPSPIEVRLFVEPTQAHATLMTGVNVGNAECRYLLEARAYGGSMYDVEWLDSRSTFQHALETDTLRVSAEERRGFWYYEQPFKNSTEWGWGGPTSLLPVTINGTLYFRIRGQTQRDSVMYTFVCLRPETSPPASGT